MRTAIRSVLVLLVITICTTACALTINEQVTLEYLCDHLNQFTVKVAKGKNGLIDFRVTRTLSKPVYLVAHLSVHHEGRVIAESHTPSFTRNRENTFYFSISPEDVTDSTFELGESSFTESGGQAVPVLGTINYQFKLMDFVPEWFMKEDKNHSDREGVTFPSLHVR